MPNLKIFNSPINFIDEKILESLTRSGRHEAYKQSLQFKSSTIGGDRVVYALKDVDAVDTKSGPLLSHVSMMIAALCLLVTKADVSNFKKYFLGIEILIYAFIACCCLRCIHVEEIGNSKVPYSDDLHRTPMTEDVFKEAALKMHILRFANSFVMLLTAFMLMTTPLLFLF